jgi:hypothetical protein
MIHAKNNISLTDGEKRWVRETVVKRVKEDSKKAGCVDKHGAANGKQDECLGYEGEVAVQKYIGRKKYTITINNFDKSKPDIFPDIEVRTRSKPEYELLIRKDDVPNRKYVLVVKVPEGYNIVGWMWAREVFPHIEWISNHGGNGDAWFVPQFKLHDPELLKQ